MSSPTDARTDAPQGMGFLVFGMHRSGTSAVARLLGEAGADLGDRILPGSAGNEEGHWEDAFAVETNERLLADLGRSWDDPRPLPPDWLQSLPAQDAVGRIAAYLSSSRQHQPAWAIKDPRMCLLAEAWMQAIARAGCPHAVVLLARHPTEVAGSLAARDGMAPAKAELAWLRHTLAAERATRGSRRIVLTYGEFLRAPSNLIERLRALPGGDVLRLPRTETVRPERRHHHAVEISPGLLADVWQQFLNAGDPDATVMDACARRLAEGDALYAPVLGDAMRESTELWRRTARAEAALVDLAADGPGGPVSLHRRLADLGRTLDAGIERVMKGISDDIRRMQAEHARALESAARMSAELQLVREERSQQEKQRLDLEHALDDARRHIGDLDEVVADAREAGRVSASQLEEQVRRSEHLQRRLDRVEADLALVLGSRSWRMTRPLRVLARALRGDMSEQERARIRQALLPLARARLLPERQRQRILLGARRTVRESEADVPRSPASPAPSNPSRPDVFVWAVIDWHFRMQRPQHLARSLAEQGHRVFYLSNNLVDDEAPGFGVERLDNSGRLFQVFLHAKGAPAIYFGSPATATVAQLRRSLGELMQWAESDGGLCIVQHPFWTEVAGVVPGSELLYDCMDHHAGFADNAPDVLRAEARLIEQSDLVVVTSEWLDRELADSKPQRALIRNGCDFEHFRQPPAARYRDADGRPVIGYYGAIAEWFDVELVRSLARAFPDCRLLLVGADTTGARAQLAEESNIAFTGEVPYDRLPYYLYGFDVALLPFRVVPLTLATNPVKVYEYLCAGKPVISVDLPELRHFGDLVRRAQDHEDFLRHVREALREADPDMAQRRIAFAAGQTWLHRARQLDEAIACLPEPLVSVIVLTYNNLEFTKACLQSVAAFSEWGNLEVIVVDNASTDGTPAFLRDWEAAGAGRRAILNGENVGFAAGNNIGLAAARGEYLVLLNNDTYVTPRWIRTMVNHLARNPDIGVLGPVTNNIGNEARIDIHYSDMEGMRKAAASYTRRHIGSLMDIATAAFFCVAMRRSTYEKVGALDEAFGIGFFEDDDYCRRVQAAGLRVTCADDVFVHHHLSASFDALKAERKRELFERNKAIYEAKWGAWIPHAYRSGEHRAV